MPKALDVLIMLTDTRQYLLQYIQQGGCHGIVGLSFYSTLHPMLNVVGMYLSIYLSVYVYLCVFLTSRVSGSLTAQFEEACDKTLLRKQFVEDAHIIRHIAATIAPLPCRA